MPSAILDEAFFTMVGLVVMYGAWNGTKGNIFGVFLSLDNFYTTHMM